MAFTKYCIYLDKSGEGGRKLLFRTMYVCMYGGAGETLRLKYTMGIRAMTKNYFVGRGGEEEEQGEEKRKTEK